MICETIFDDIKCGEPAGQQFAFYDGHIEKIFLTSFIILL